MKKIYLLISLILITSCDSNQSFKQSMNYDESFSNDLSLLFEFKDQESIYQETDPFLMYSYIQPSKEYSDFYIVTVDIAYSTQRIEDIRIITLPFSLLKDDKPTSISHVGYDGQIYNLDSYVDKASLTFKGYRISYLTKDSQDGVKVFLRGKINDILTDFYIYISHENFIIENNN